MLSTGPNRIDRSRPTRSSSEWMPGGLALSQIVAGVMENWDQIEQELPWNRQTDPTPHSDGQRQQAAQQASQHQRPGRPEEKARSQPAVAVAVESEDLPWPGQPTLTTVKEVKEEARPKGQPGPSSDSGEAVQTPNWRAPELPRAEGGGMPASFAVPNHSAGASGFGNTWSHVAKTAQPDSIVLSE